MSYRIGILGAGQLGRMLALAGYPLGARFVFLGKNQAAPAAQVGHLVQGAFDDATQIGAVASQVDVLTFDLENVSVSAVRKAGAEALCRPPLKALEVAQDRLSEKTLFTTLGIPTPPYRAVDSLADLQAAVSEIGLPAVLKTRRLGYDGRGQRLLREKTDLEPAFHDLGAVPMIVEGFIQFTREVSMLAVRSPQGGTSFYPVTENQHQTGILRVSRAPAPDATAVTREARAHATSLLQYFDYVGVLAIEFFEHNGILLANEIAPRVHNSGHWTIEGAVTSQFENHIRAVLDLPLGDASAVGHAAMVNLIGKMPATEELLSIRGLHLHNYGKSERPNRKLGHINLVSPDAASLTRPLAAVQRLLQG